MIVSVTALGSRHGDAAGAVARVVAYLDGRGPERAGRSPEWWDKNASEGQGPCTHGLASAGEGALAYYADSVEGPGRWLGRGIAGFSPTREVGRAQLEAMLLGRHPRTGVQLLEARGSATRAQHLGRRGEPVERSGPDDELLSLPQAATLLGVSPQYLRRVASATATARRELGQVGLSVETLPALDGPYLDATHDGPRGHWRVTRGEVARFEAARKAPSAVIGYDLTFSVPKSVSILWAQADQAGRETIVAAVEEAVAAGVAYLQENAAFVRAAPGWQATRAAGLLAASYLHGTSRALDPQLHAHVVVANMAEGRGGGVRALDGRALFTHAKTAGYLAAAELRHQLSVRLGVEWAAPERGLADIAGVPREAIVALSKRSQELEAAIGQIEAFFTGGRHVGARGRQIAAYLTRAAKDEHGVDPAALRPWWASQLEGVGFGQRVAQRCLGRRAPLLVTEEDREKLFARLGWTDGVTATAATFTRRDVIQHVAEWAGDRLRASEVADLADSWLATDVVVRLAGEGRTHNLGESGSQTIPNIGEATFTTRSMIEIEDRLLATYERGRFAGVGVVPPKDLDSVLAVRAGLGEDQAAMVRSICTSGHRVQCVLGPAGSGKTFAVAAAARAWERAGYIPVGATVQGTASEVLRDATGMECSTVADLLTRLDFGVPKTLSDRHVVVVDESSTLGNQDLARLARHVERYGATLRLIGDPAQHSAVAAGGGWRALLERHPEDRAELVERRRQAAPEMTEVRLASQEYAAGQIAAAIERLRGDNRVVEAEGPEELLDALAADWYLDRLRRAADPAVPASSMVADHHAERRELNRRARALLSADGTLRGPALEVGGQVFQTGDEVISLKQERALFPKGGFERDRVRTGERGVVVEVRTGRRPAVVVDFERRGRVEVGEEFLSERVRPGVVGVLAHSYALTSHMAQGETYFAGRHLSTEVSSREGVYVGLTRGKGDAALYMVRRRELVPAADAHTGMPLAEDETDTVAAVTRSLESQRAERLAADIDPLAGEVARLRRMHSLASLAELAADDNGGPAARAYRQAAASVAQRARLDPPAALVARLGPRPAGGDERAAWDRAVGGVGVYQARWGAVPTPAVGHAAWVLGPAPTGPALHLYNAVAEALHQAEVTYLARRPTADLSDERCGLQRSLIAGPAPWQQAAAAAAVAQARQAEAEVDSGRQRLSAELDGLGGRRWRRNAQAIEITRRSLQAVERSAAVAAEELSRAEAALGALDQELPAHQRVEERLAVVEAALDRQVSAAVETPAGYLISALGEAPEDGVERGTWLAAAERIESYRHRHLACGPEAGALGPGGGLVGAIGVRPDDYLEQLAWDHAAELTQPSRQLGVDGLELSL